MTRILTAAVLAMLATGCSSDPAPTTPAEPAKPEAKAKAPEKPAEPAKPAEGEAVADAFDAEATFKMTCGPCHGEGGAGDGAAAAALDPKPANFNEPSFWETRDSAHIQKVIKLGGAAVGKSALMAPYGGQFNDEQIGALAKYIEDTFKPE